jgi:hypothetical protein
MSRSASAYASKQPENYNSLLAILAEKRFLLLSQNGPTVFKICDDEDKEYKVTLGHPNKCTCDEYKSLPNGKYCIHLAYCIIKRARVDKSHPLAYQMSFTDKELEQILSGKFSSSQRTGGESGSRAAFLTRGGGSLSSTRNRAGAANEGIADSAGESNTNSDSSDVPSSGDAAKSLFPSLNTVPRKEITEDEICPICCDSLLPDIHPLTWCRRGCGSNLHANCMLKYSQHIASKSSIIPCPLCRESWNLALLKFDCSAKVAKKDSKHESNGGGSCEMLKCSSCSCFLRKFFHRCLECSQKNSKNSYSSSSGAATSTFVDFCEDCYSRRVTDHKLHHFLTSDASQEKCKDVYWAPCKNPYSYDPLLEGISDFNSNVMNNDSNALPRFQSYEQFQERNVTLLISTLIAALPLITPARLEILLKKRSALLPSSTNHTVSHIVNQPSSPNRVKFCWCQNNGAQGLYGEESSLVELLCGHTAHSRCIKDEIEVIIREDSSHLMNYRCSHENCGRIMFHCLQRRKRKPPKKKEDTMIDSKSSSSQNHNRSSLNAELQQYVHQRLNDRVHGLLPISGSLRTHSAGDTSSLLLVNGITNHNPNSNNNEVPGSENLNRRHSVQSEGNLSNPGRPSRETVRQRILLNREREHSFIADSQFSSSILQVGGVQGGQSSQSIDVVVDNGRSNSTGRPVKRSGLQVGKLRPIGKRSVTNDTESSDLNSLVPLVTNISVGIADQSNSVQNNNENATGLTFPRTADIRQNRIIRMNQQRNVGLQQLENRFENNSLLSVSPLRSRNQTPLVPDQTTLASVGTNPMAPALSQRTIRRGLVHVNRIKNSNSGKGEYTDNSESESELSTLMNINHYRS